MPAATHHDSPAAAAEADSPASPSHGQPLTLDGILQSLGAHAAGQSHTAAVLRECYLAQKDVLEWQQRLPSREGENSMTLSELDAVLLRWLHAAYLQASTLPGLMRSGRGTSPPLVPLAGLIASCGLLSPFISGVDQESGRLAIGHPTNDGATADSVSELVRMAGAALCCYNDYLTRPAQAGHVPSDESALLFASVAISSCQNEVAAEAIAGQIAATLEAHPWLARRGSGEGAAAASTGGAPGGSEGPTASPSAEETEAGLSAAERERRDFARLSAFGIPQIRWLMHWLRAQLSEHFAAVRYLLGDQAGHKDNLVAAQQDKLAMLKLIPSSLTSFVLYCRACLQFQQIKAAYIFSSKGLVVADALRDDAVKALLLLINATAAVLGGAGPSYSYRAVAEAHKQALETRDKALLWLPGPFQALLDLEPEVSIIGVRVLKQPATTSSGQATEDDAGRQGRATTGTSDAAAQHVTDSSTKQVARSEAGSTGEGREGYEGDAIPVLELAYTVPEPSSLPPGAIEQDKGEDEGPGAGSTGLPGVPEEGEEEEQAVQGSAGGSTEARQAAAKAGRARVVRTRPRGPAGK